MIKDTQHANKHRSHFLRLAVDFKFVVTHGGSELQILENQDSVGVTSVGGLFGCFSSLDMDGDVAKLSLDGLAMAVGGEEVHGLKQTWVAGTLENQETQTPRPAPISCGSDVQMP